MRVNPEEDSYESDSDSMDRKFLNAVEKGDLQQVITLLRGGVNPGVKNNLAIMTASRKGHTEIVRLLLDDSRVNPDDQSNSAIKNAVLFGRTEVVRLLLKDKRVDPSDDNNFAIERAFKDNRIEIVKILATDPKVMVKLQNDNILMTKLCGNKEILEVIKSLYPYVVSKKCGDVPTNSLSVKEYANIVICILNQMSRLPVYRTVVLQLKQILLTNNSITKHDLNNLNIEQQVYSGVYRTDMRTIMEINKLLNGYIYN